MTAKATIESAPSPEPGYRSSWFAGFVTEQLLNATDISAASQKVRSERMAPTMNASNLMDAGSDDRSFESFLDSSG